MRSPTPDLRTLRHGRQDCPCAHGQTLSNKSGERAERTMGTPALRPLFLWESSRNSPHLTDATLKASFLPTTSCLQG